MGNTKISLCRPDFGHLRNHNFIYVDKTQYLDRLFNELSSEYVFLSRPRLFGKSLLLSTIEELFKGSKELFKGLHIYDKWDWSEAYPCLSFDLSLGDFSSVERIEESLRAEIRSVARVHKIEIEDKVLFEEMFCRLIEAAAYQYRGEVVVLIDEYDAPFLGNIDDPKKARASVEVIGRFLKVLKRTKRYLRFVMLTGVTKIASLNELSGLNNLTDISFRKDFSGICGFSQSEVDNYFASSIEMFDKMFFRLKYNGYNWLGKSVYNPYDVIRAAQSGRIENFWYETGDLSFVKVLIQKFGLMSLSLAGKEFSKDVFTEISPVEPSPEALLFQNGYMTIDKSAFNEASKRTLYSLKFPNEEVQSAFNYDVMKAWLPHNKHCTYDAVITTIANAIIDEDAKAFSDCLYGCFKDMPTSWFENNEIEPVERLYATIVRTLCEPVCDTILMEEGIAQHSMVLLLIKKNQNCDNWYHRYIVEIRVGNVVRPTNGDNDRFLYLATKYREKSSERMNHHFIQLVFSNQSHRLGCMRFHHGEICREPSMTYYSD